MLTSKILNARPRSLIGDLSSQPPDPSATISTQYCMFQIPASPTPASRLEISDLRLPIAYRSAQSTAPRSHVVAHIYQSIHRRAPLTYPGLTITIPTSRHPDAGSRLPHARSQLPVRNSWAQPPRYDVHISGSQPPDPGSWFPKPCSPIQVPWPELPDLRSQFENPKTLYIPQIAALSPRIPNSSCRNPDTRKRMPDTS